MKELGIRKVLGASVNQITLMLTRNFIWLVLIAFIISAPIGWWVSSRWLEEFAYRMSLNGWTLVLPGLLALGLAVFTVVFLTIHAARSNPIKIIHQE